MIRYIIKRPVAVAMIVIAVSVLGVLALLKLPVSLLPDADVPVITVQVNNKGASALQTDQEILHTLRSRLSQIAGLRSMQSEAKMDAGSIKMTFDPETNIDLTLIEVNEKIDMAMGALPKETERPKVMKSSISDIPAFFLEMKLKESSDDIKKFAEMSDFAANVVRKRIEQLPQTAMVDISGTAGQEIMITPDYDKLRAMGLTTANIEKAIDNNNITFGALSIVDGQYRYNIHFDSQILVAEDIGNIIINHEGRMFKLSDVAKIEKRSGVRNGWVRHDGKNAVTMAIIKHSVAKMSELQHSIEETLNDLRLNHPDIEFAVSRDQTRLLAYSFSNLSENLLSGCLLTCLVLLLFLRNWRMSMIVALTIPLSLIITLLMFYVMDITLNVISLSGLILGVGMIVDNAIIVTDIIILNRQKGLNLADAVCKGVNEVFAPMLSSVLTTCSVFLPLIFLSGIAGELFFDMSVGISVSLLASLAVAVLAVPVVYYNLHKRQDKENHTKQSDVILTLWYEKAFCYVMRHQKLFVVFFIMAIPGFALFYNFIEKQRMPDLSQTDSMVYVSWNEGISEEESDKRINLLIKKAGNSILSSSSMTGNQQFVLPHTRNITGTEALAYIKCEGAEELEEAKQMILKQCNLLFNKATVVFEPVGNPFDMMLNTAENNLELHLRKTEGGRPDVAHTQEFVKKFQNRFPDIHIPEVEIDNNLLCRADVAKMAFYGVSYSSLLSKMREMTGKNKIMDINNGTNAVPVIIGADKAERDRILQSAVMNNKKVEVPVRLLLADSVVNNYKRLYSSTEGDYYPIAINDSEENIEKVMTYADSLQKTDSRIAIDYEGGYFSSRQLVSELMIVLAVALLLLYLILAAQFESLMQPLIILSEMVINCFVVLAVLWCCDVSLNLMSMIGLVVMSGIVINDSILKIDTINRYRRSGMNLLRAIMTTGSERLRPIVMTSATTIFGVLPFLSTGDMGSDLQYPLSLTIVVGMTIGTLVSLFFVPMLYYVIYRRIDKLINKKVNKLTSKQVDKLLD